MRKFIALTISFAATIITTIATVAQNTPEVYSYHDFASLFTKNAIGCPVDSKKLIEIDYKRRPSVDCKLYNWTMFRNSDGFPKRMTLGNQVFKADYGLLEENDDKIYAIGYWQYNDYYIFIARIENSIEDKTFIDYYVFSKDGMCLYVLCLYEAEHLYYNEKYERDTVYIAATIPSKGIVYYEENRYNVNVKIEYQIQDDGILREVALSTIGLYEVVDKDGYVNVREKPDAKSKILYTIESGSIITSHTENGSKWEQVISIEGSDKQGGYVHSSRLRNYW